jgi:hypothetical protein
MKNMRKKSVAVLAGLAITGLVGAAAASLGGIAADDLGADADVIASCDTDGVDVGYTTDYSDTLDIYVVTAVTVSDIAPSCDGQTISATLTDVAADELGSGTDVVTGDTFTFSITPADAELVEGIAIVISG